MKLLFFLLSIVAAGSCFAACSPAECNMMCSNGLSMGGTALLDTTVEAFGGASGVVCLNGSCASGALVVAGGQASTAISAPQFSGSLSITPAVTPTPSFDDASTGPITFEVNAQIGAPFDALHDGDVWEMSVTKGDGTEIFSMSRTVTYNELSACQNTKCRQAVVP